MSDDIVIGTTATTRDGGTSWSCTFCGATMPADVPFQLHRCFVASPSADAPLSPEERMERALRWMLEDIVPEFLVDHPGSYRAITVAQAALSAPSSPGAADEDDAPGVPVSFGVSTDAEFLNAVLRRPRRHHE
jgi:hypothetical protein